MSQPHSCRLVSPAGRKPLAKAAFFGKKKKKKKKSQVGVHYKLGSISSYKLPNLNEIYHFFIGMVPH